MPKFRLPDVPSSETNSPVEIADWWEIVALCSDSARASLMDLRATTARQGESDPDTDAEDDILEEGRFDFAIEEIKYRQFAIPAEHYPFAFGASEKVLEFKNTDANRWPYIFLLLTTRLNMNERRLQAGIDGALLFEEVCEVALAGFGGIRHKAHRFGTSAGQGNFPAKLTALFDDLNEFKLRDDRVIPNHGGDDGIDIALWNQFYWSGAQPGPKGKLILLAQCKTGTSWGKKELSRLRPSSFFESWMMPTPLGDSARAFMVSSRIDAPDWEDCHRYGGLIFDRCRIADCIANKLSGNIADRVRAWSEAALTCDDLPS